MGLLSEVSGDTVPELKASDEALLIHAMMVMVSSDGVLDEHEAALLSAIAHTLPEFREPGKWEAKYEEAYKTAQQYKSLEESLQALADIKSENVRKKAFSLCVDLAFASGDVTQSEDQILEGMQRVMEISDDEAKRIIEVVMMKYAA